MWYRSLFNSNSLDSHITFWPLFHICRVDQEPLPLQALHQGGRFNIYRKDIPFLLLGRKTIRGFVFSFATGYWKAVKVRHQDFRFEWAFWHSLVLYLLTNFYLPVCFRQPFQTHRDFKFLESGQLPCLLLFNGAWLHSSTFFFLCVQHLFHWLDHNNPESKGRWVNSSSWTLTSSSLRSAVQVWYKFKERGLFAFSS